MLHKLRWFAETADSIARTSRCASRLGAPSAIPPPGLGACPGWPRQAPHRHQNAVRWHAVARAGALAAALAGVQTHLAECSRPAGRPRSSDLAAASSTESWRRVVFPRFRRPEGRGRNGARAGRGGAGWRRRKTGSPHGTLTMAPPASVPGRPAAPAPQWTVDANGSAGWRRTGSFQNLCYSILSPIRTPA